METKIENTSRHPRADKILLSNALLLDEVKKLLMDGQTVMLKATGDSMLPFLVGGRDSVLLRKPSVTAPLQVGQIALACLPDHRYVLHRIVRIHEAEIVLMGDGNFRQTETCRIPDVAGVVTQIVRNGRRIDNDARSERCKAKAWNILRPIRRYLLYIYKRIWRQ